MGCWFSKPVVPEPYDYLRNPPLRYLGYAGHIGSACSGLLPRSVSLVPQMAATAYVMADIFHKSSKSAEKGESQKRVMINGIDALLWQSLASIIIPGIVFKGLKTTIKTLLANKPRAGQCASKPCPFPCTPLGVGLLPCALAILATPFIFGPIDKAVDFIMNSTYRQWTAPDPDESKDPRIIAKENKERTDKAAREEKLRAERIAKECREAEERAKRAEKEELERIKREEKEAKERARKKCMEEARLLREQLAAEDKALKEKLKQEEQEFRERQAKIAEEQRKKLNAKIDCD